MAEANIKAVITADDRASRTLSKFGGNVSKFGRVAAAGISVASAAVTAFGVASVKAFIEEENAIAQLNAVLKSTKGVAGVTEQAALDLAASLQKVTTFADDAIIGGENLLLTFTKIGKDIFPQATETMLDMSQALGQDIKSSAIQLGKALQDPILGITALRRVGVNFSDAQKEVVKRLVETGQSAKAQKLILKELQTEFGGAAQAAAGTFGGKLKQLQNIVGDVMEEVGAALVEVLEGPLKEFAAWFTENREEIVSTTKAVVRGMILITEAIVFTVSAFNKLGFAIGYVGAGIFFNVMRIVKFFVMLRNKTVGLIQQIINKIQEIPGAAAKAVKSAVSSAAGIVPGGGIAKKIVDFLPGFATGTNFAPGGPAIVGERGPELVNLPRGSQVIPNNQLGSQSTINFNVNIGMFAGSASERRRIAETMFRDLQDLASRHGQTAAQMMGAK